jgi:RHS repeat-associated protein
MVKELVDEDGRVAWAGSFSAWGTLLEERRDERARRVVSSPFRLVGQYYDAETGLGCTRFRYFEAEVGRWISPDPIGLAGGLNVFAFDGSPGLDVDPLGLCKGGNPPKAYSVAYEMQLLEADYGIRRDSHFRRANNALAEAMRGDKDFAAMVRSVVTSIGENQYPSGPDAPDGWVWHHHVDEGKMQLVPKEQHTPGSEYWPLMHPDGSGGYAKWAVPNGAPPNRSRKKA